MSQENHGHFMRFLLYTQISGNIVLYHLSKRLIDVYSRPLTYHYTRKYVTICVILTILDSLAMFMLGMLGIYEAKNAVENKTTIESMQLEKLERTAKKLHVDLVNESIKYFLKCDFNLEG